ncbi:hypothetical protein M1K46_19290 [Fictibacillus sp. WQ 8-8]|uniref:hypothetical protein n=1 Tax=Fictibacillus sp. WQ 8-8 TaxID=2938788 RepID=UPI0021099FA4|nr:hypothetical protein [Fictibacillus sp. WQ 8-8]MCQ6267776.1 hypothetical protein [Fictibacillus sp. WQ 8-8]
MKEKALRKLRKEFQKTYTIDQQRQAKFFLDTWDSKTYTWTFHLDGHLVLWVYIYQTKTVLKCVY